MGGSTEWLTEAHIQFLINCVFHDKTNPVLKPFHVVPVSVTAQITYLFEGHCNPDIKLKGIDQYCKENGHCLDSFIIFFVKNVGNLHWGLDVAVNPFHLLAIVTGAELDEHAHEQIY